MSNDDGAIFASVSRRYHYSGLNRLIGLTVPAAIAVFCAFHAWELMQTADADVSGYTDIVVLTILAICNLFGWMVCIFANAAIVLNNRGLAAEIAGRKLCDITWNELKQVRVQTISIPLSRDQVVRSLIDKDKYPGSLSVLLGRSIVFSSKIGNSAELISLVLEKAEQLRVPVSRI